uniref:Globin family profile domain-containing protein n=1 Tax=Acrobeloides nanus TaxID=290746 RepID=A0A914D5H4_9BILA
MEDLSIVGDVKHIVETLNANQLQNIMIDLAKFHASVLDYETRNIDFLKQFPYDNDGVKQFVNCVSGLVWKLVEIEPNLHEMITYLWPYISNPEVFIENVSKKYGCISVT